MAIYLVQHGLSLPKHEDLENGLSKQGVAETEQIAQVAKGYHVAVDRICHSGKKRAYQTAEILGRALSPPNGLDCAQGLNPLNDVQPWSLRLATQDNLMLVGHLPFMEKLTGYLTTGKADLAPFKFQNSGIVCLDRNEETDRWFIQWTLSPHIG